MNKYSGGRVALGCLFAVFCGMLTPLLLSFGTVLLWSPILIVVLYAWSGAIPALLCAVLTVASPGLMALEGAGITWMVCATLTLALPGLITVVLIRRRLPFPKAVLCAIGTQLLMMALCVLALSLMHGPDLVGGFVSWFRVMMGDTGYGAAYGNLMGEMLMSMGRFGLFGLNTGIDFTGSTLTAAQQTQLINAFADLLDRVLRRNLASMILCSGALTGLLSYSLAARICARRGDVPRVPYMHIHEWRLPRDMVIALPVIALLCAILNAAQLTGMDAAYVAMLDLCYLAFAIQGAGALARRLRQSGTGWGRRTGMVVTMFILMQWMLSVIGFWSALFGSNGVITLYLQKKNQTKGDR